MCVTIQRGRRAPVKSGPNRLWALLARISLARLIVHNEFLLAIPERGLGGGVRGRVEYPPCRPCFDPNGLDPSGLLMRASPVLAL
jgi:hypothetical protein